MLKLFTKILQVGIFVTLFCYLSFNMNSKHLQQRLIVNRTNPAAQVLVYNSVPKCSSRTFSALIRRLTTERKYQHYSGKRITPFPKMNEEQQSSLVDGLADYTGHVSIDNHFYNLDWTKYEHKIQVNLVNIVREPVERFSSLFHHVRNGWDAAFHVRPPVTWFNQSLESCVLENDTECQIGGNYTAPTAKGFPDVWPNDLQLSYFCGQDEECFDPSSVRALKRAMEAVETQYSVVGVVEEYNSTLHVLEAYLPGWFGGATKIFNSMEQKNVNPHAKVTEEVREVLRQRLHLDIEFYSFVKQRLALQLNNL